MSTRPPSRSRSAWPRPRSTATAPAAEDVPRIKARLLLNYAGNDERVNATWPPYEAAL